MDAIALSDSEPVPLNRRQRRALVAAGYYQERNGLSHERLTVPSFKLLKSLLTEYGNTLSDGHESALMALVGLMTKMAQGELRGRWAFGLPTGMGKTTAIIAWVATLVACRLDHVSVAVACSKVEALCQMKRDMIACGVDPKRIGLIHSYANASEPSTVGEDRQIMLVTHARVRDGDKLAEFSHHTGKPRDLMLYDESLVTTDSIGLAVRDLKGCVGYLASKFEDSEPHQAPLAYLRACLSTIKDKLTDLTGGADVPEGQEAIIDLPVLTYAQREAFKVTLGKAQVVMSGVNLLDIASEPIRVINTGNGGVVSYTVAVPRELENILVLDASHPVRKLIHLDRSIRDAERDQDNIKRIAPLASLKQFDRVTIHQMFAGGGRSTMATDFGKPEKDRKVTREIVEVVKRIPLTEAVLIFAYKDRDGVKYQRTLQEDLARSGIDTKATVTVKGEQRDRISVLTWGNETSLNTYSYCQHVILAGIVQRSQVDLASAYLGQTGDLSGGIARKVISDLIATECAHVAYQAASRGNSRETESGYAKKMDLWLIHRDATIRHELSKVMPGAVWTTWEPEHGTVTRGAITAVAARIVDYLGTLPPEATRVSTKAIKKATGLVDVPKMTFTRALTAVTKSVAWTVDGRSLIRS